jgi:hypothetical protein
MSRPGFLTLGVLGFTSALPAPAAELAPRDFAYGMTISTPGPAPAYRVAIPYSVYQRAAYEDLRDLRVFNARGEVVPYELTPAPAETVQQPPGVSLPFFALRGNSRPTLEGMRITIRSPGTAVNVEAVGRAADAGLVTGYLVDARELPFPLSQLRLKWQDNAPQFSGLVRVDSSDDLASWQTARSDAPVVNLLNGTAQLVQGDVGIATPARAKFWRLTWVGPAAPFAVTSVTAFATQIHRPEHSSLTVLGTEVADHPEEFAFDLDATLPVNRVNIELPEPNSVNRIELLSRAHPTDPWRSVTAGDFYRVRNDGLDHQNQPLEIPTNADRYWLARATHSDAKFGGSPRLTAYWATEDVVFLARGGGPFTLAYGNGKAAMGTTTLDSLLSGVTVSRAALEIPVALGGAGRRALPARIIPWKMAVLWTVLALGVLLLAWMSYRLAREIGRPKP